MKYYLVEIITTTSDAEARNIYGYSDRNTAVKMFHLKMGSNMNESTCEKAQMAVINSANGIEMEEIYTATTTETTTE